MFGALVGLLTCLVCPVVCSAWTQLGKMYLKLEDWQPLHKILKELEASCQVGLTRTPVTSHRGLHSTRTQHSAAHTRVLVYTFFWWVPWLCWGVNIVIFLLQLAA